MEESPQVWEAMMDDCYWMTVTRMAEYRGRLRIVDTDTRQMLHEEDVDLNYGALFGPDIAYVSRWQEIAERVVDEG